MPGFGQLFAGQSARRAAKLRRHIMRLYRAQRDLLAPASDAELSACLAQITAELGHPTSDDRLESLADRLTALSERWLVDTSRNRLREITEMVLIGLVIVASIRVFFLQPTSIPTGSMQPTLNGVRVVNLANNKVWKRPASRLETLVELVFRGRSYYRVVAEDSGRILRIEPPEPIAPLLDQFTLGYKQRFLLGETWHTVWFVPEELPPVQGVPQNEVLFAHARVDRKRVFLKGEEIINVVVLAGDRVLVDRLSYHFRKPRRGEIVVFTAHGIRGLQPGTYYLKRLVGLGGERVCIGNDRHVVINGQRLDASTPGFEKVYSFDGPAKEDEYSGHVNDRIAQRHRNPPGLLAPRFPNETAAVRVRPGHCLVLGDNTLMSLDSRVWGDISETNIIGRVLCRYWPDR